MKFATPRRIDLLTGFLAGFLGFCFLMTTQEFQASHCQAQTEQGHTSPASETKSSAAANQDAGARNEEEHKHSKPKPSFVCGFLGFPKALIAYKGVSSEY